MKKIILVIIVMISFSIKSFSQKIIKNNAVINFTQLPLISLGANIENYQSIVFMPYTDVIIERLASAEEEYQQELEGYLDKVARAKAVHDEKMEGIIKK